MDTVGGGCGDGEGEGGAHLEGAALPREDGGLALVAEEVRLALDELGAEDLRLAIRKLSSSSRSAARPTTDERMGLALIATDVPGSSSNLYSVSGSSTHSFDAVGSDWGWDWDWDWDWAWDWDIANSFL